MPEDPAQSKRDRRNTKDRARRQARGLRKRGSGGAGKGQGRKMQDIPDRPSCCDRLMVSVGKSWRCPVCKITTRKIQEKVDG